MSAPIPGRYADQFNLRLPDGMRDRLKAEAEANKRSMNAEIVARLEDSLAISLAERVGPTSTWLDNSKNLDVVTLLNELQVQARENLANTNRLVSYIASMKIMDAHDKDIKNSIIDYDKLRKEQFSNIEFGRRTVGVRDIDLSPDKKEPGDSD